jgi:hypothetical protein
MKHIVYILALGLWSCNNQKEVKTLEINSVDTLKTVSADIQQQSIYIKDKSQYNQAFINELTNAYHNESIKLIENFIIVGNDTTQFPTELEINKKTVFTGIRNNKFYELILIRKNLTEIVFTFFIRNNEDEIKLPIKEGTATLGALFFLASEVDEDEVTAEVYGSSEYWKKDGNCWLSIRVGISKDKNGENRAKISFGCEEKSSQHLTLDECPTLRTK